MQLLKTILCFGQDKAMFVKICRNENLAKPAFIAMVMNLWTLIISLLSVGLICAKWFWYPIAKYSNFLFIVFCVSSFIFLATMHFVGMAQGSQKPQKKEEVGQNK